MCFLPQYRKTLIIKKKSVMTKQTNKKTQAWNYSPNAVSKFIPDFIWTHIVYLPCGQNAINAQKLTLKIPYLYNSTEVFTNQSMNDLNQWMSAEEKLLRDSY